MPIDENKFGIDFKKAVGFGQETGNSRILMNRRLPNCAALLDKVE